MSEFDLIVVGAGGSGLAAAVSAAEQGASVLVLEKQPQPGGTTGIAVGSLTASETRIQARAGVLDSWEEHCVDAAKFADPEIEARNNDPLRRAFLRQAAETLHWLMEMGLKFHGPSPEPPNRVARMHNVVPGAKAYIATLQARLTRLGGELIVNAPVVRLLQDDVSGAVLGVVASIEGQSIEYLARHGVVLAAGDYANSAETIARFKGDRFAAIEGINPFATGDGHRLAEAAGAELVNMDVTYGPELRFVAPPGRSFQQLLPVRGPLVKAIGLLLPLVPNFVLNRMIRRLLVTWQHPEEALFHDGAILVNRSGERFCEETVWPEREIAVAEQPSKEAFLLLDGKLVERYSVWPHFVSTAPKIAYAYVRDYLKLRPDVAVQAMDLEGLARAREIPADNLRATVDAFNTAQKERGAAQRERGAAQKERGAAERATDRLDGAPWVLLGPVKAWFTTTEGGAAIDQDFRVLDRQGRPIRGLFAVGQNGLGGQILWGHGLHIAWAMTSGRLVGKQVCSK